MSHFWRKLRSYNVRSVAFMVLVIGGTLAALTYRFMAGRYNWQALLNENNPSPDNTFVSIAVTLLLGIIA